MRTLLVALCLSLLPSGAFAQEAAAAPVEDRPVAQLNEVERGLFFGVEAGGLFLFSPKGEKAGFSPGRTYGVTVGGDIGSFLTLAVMVLGTNTDTPAGFVSDGAQKLGGDFSSLVLGGLARVNFYGRADSNQVKRLFLYARAGAGYALMGPKNFYDGGDIVALGGLGLEYFTHLRHFSLGIGADFVYGVKHMGPGLSLTPHLRYTF